jgi:hypothetical protein
MLSALELLGDLNVEIVFGILRLPIAKRHTQSLKQSAVDIPALFGRGDIFVLGDELQLVRFPQCLEQVLERFTDNGFSFRAGNLLQPVQVSQIGVDKQLTHRSRSVSARPAESAGLSRARERRRARVEGKWLAAL